MAFSRVEMMALTKEVAMRMLRMVRLKRIFQVKPTGFVPKCMWDLRARGESRMTPRFLA